MLPGDLRAAVVMAGGGDRLHRHLRDGLVGALQAGVHPRDSWVPKRAAEGENAGSCSVCVEGGFEQLVCDPDWEERGSKVGLVQPPRPPPFCLQLGPPDPSARTAVKMLSLHPRALVHTV